MKSNAIFFILAALGLLLIAGCTAGPNEFANVADPGGRVAGFWFGLWHGAICPVTFILSLFMENIHFYEIHNDGGWYNFGFVLGSGVLFGGGSKAACRR